MVLSTALFDATCKAWYPDQIAAPRHAANGPAVDVKNRRDAEAVNSPFVLSLWVLAQGVAPAGATVKDVGYFAITVARRRAMVQKLALTDGHTATNINLPPGRVRTGFESFGRRRQAPVEACGLAADGGETRPVKG